MRSPTSSRPTSCTTRTSAGARTGGYSPFPSEDTQWSIVGGAEQHVESTLDLEYQTGLLRDSPFSLTVESLYDRSGTPRFYGIGNNSFQINQTVYIDQQIGAYATLGWNITHAWQLAYTFAAKKVKVLGTTLPGVPPITSRFDGHVRHRHHARAAEPHRARLRHPQRHRHSHERHGGGCLRRRREPQLRAGRLALHRSRRRRQILLVAVSSRSWWRPMWICATSRPRITSRSGR